MLQYVLNFSINNFVIFALIILKLCLCSFYFIPLLSITRIGLQNIFDKLLPGFLKSTRFWVYFQFKATLKVKNCLGSITKLKYSV